jgi:protoheme IX farnesyltransferase
MLPVGVIPWLLHISGMVSLIIILIANLFMLWQSIRLYREMSVQAARRVMFSSYIYLPVVLLSLLADKIAGV